MPEQTDSVEKKEWFTRGQKTLLLNAGTWAVIMVYGLSEWDYNESSFHFENEHWFGRKTEYGGLDKLSHAWSSYAMSHLFSYVYRKWNYTDKEANLYGALSSLSVNTFMEIADGFSPSQGFSYEDMMMNILGCGLGYVLGEYPDLARKFDFRMEITPKFDSQDLKIGTNYERQTYLLVAKADGFDFIENPYLKYLEVHLGYNFTTTKDMKKMARIIDIVISISAWDLTSASFCRNMSRQPFSTIFRYPTHPPGTVFLRIKQSRYSAAVNLI